MHNNKASLLITDTNSLTYEMCTETFGMIKIKTTTAINIKKTQHISRSCRIRLGLTRARVFIQSLKLPKMSQLFLSS